MLRNHRAWILLVAMLLSPHLGAAQANRPEDDLAEFIRGMWRRFNSRNVDSIVLQGSHEGIGFGWRGQAWRTSQWGGVSAEELRKNSAEMLRQQLERDFASWDYYHVDVTDLHTAVDGDIGLAWGTYNESFKPKNGAPETAHVRYPETYKRDGNPWRSLLYHRDIE